MPLFLRPRLRLAGMEAVGLPIHLRNLEIGVGCGVSELHDESEASLESLAVSVNFVPWGQEDGKGPGRVGAYAEVVHCFPALTTTF